MDSLGDETLPTGWERTPVRGDEVSVRRESGTITVAATRSALADADAEWELTVEHEADGSTVVEPFGRVGDRETAVEALRSCMNAVDTALPADDDGAPDRVTASEMRLDEVVQS